MVHNCRILDKDSELTLLLNKWSNGRKALLRLIIISNTNPLCSKYFRSDLAVKKEQIRHLQSPNDYIIHPLSKFNKWYTLCTLILYILVCIAKPMEASMMISQNKCIHSNTWFIIDIGTWIDILLQLFIGYIDSETKLVELRQRKIIKKYLLSIFFITDILGSVPHYVLCFLKVPRQILGFQIFCCLLRQIRLISVVKIIYEMSVFTFMMSKITAFTISTSVIFFFTLHYVTCLQVSVGKIIRIYFFEEHYVENNGIESFNEMYVQYMFKASAYLLGIILPPQYIEKQNPEDYIFAVVIYIFGKIFMASSWIILAMIIINTRAMKIKYQGIMNQIYEYLRQKQIPVVLRQKIFDLYRYKYKKKYFKENTITNMLSNSIRTDIRIDMCRSLVTNVSLFKNFTFEQLNEVVPLLKSEIFLQGDLIIQSGTLGDSMYFLASGTVAVYTPSGKEICHLEDGAYFGEMSLVLKGQHTIATVIAIDICQIYRLKRRDFEKTIYRYKSILRTIIETAEKRLKEFMIIEEEHKKSLFEQTYAVVS